MIWKLGEVGRGGVVLVNRVEIFDFEIFIVYFFFRVLKIRGNILKYGFIFYFIFIGRVVVKNKGRIFRYLVNKCSIVL